jgi:hypothetical protein
MKTTQLWAVPLVLLIVGSVNAALITFDGLTGSERAPFPTPYVEDNFQVMPVTGRWFEGHGGNTVGNPIPAINGDTFTASLEVTNVLGDLFTFNSIDIGNNFTDGLAAKPVSYTLDGLLGGTTVFTLSGEASVFQTISSPSALKIDTLRLSMVRLEADGYAIDNIRLNEPALAAVPEPSSAILLAGLFGICAVGSRFCRHHKS